MNAPTAPDRPTPPAATDETVSEIKFTLPAEHAGLRIDVAIAKLVPNLSRTYAGRLLKDGAILVGGREAKPALKVRGGEVVEIELPEPEEIEARPENIPLDVLFEDADIIAVNKPAGMVAHPSAGHASGALVNALLYHCKDLSSINGKLRPGIVHRLDKDTTGAIVAAKNDAAHQSLAEQFAARTVCKEYLALCHGNPLRPVFSCDGRIGRHPVRRTEMAVLRGPQEGRAAHTDFEVQERFRGPLFMVRALPKTGRTHQIRVHLAKAGYPILCDPLYGRESVWPELGLRRHALHAFRLTVTHPRSGKAMTFEAPLAPDMAAALDVIRKRG